MSKRNILSIHRDIAKANAREFLREARKPKQTVDLNTGTVPELRELAKRLGVKVTSKMKKADLIAAIGPVEVTSK